MQGGLSPAARPFPPTRFETGGLRLETGAPVTAILNLRGRNRNSGCSDDHWRRISA